MSAIPWIIHFFERHADDDPHQACPGMEAYRAWPPEVRQKVIATLKAVSEAPPHKFAGGGRWEAMHGDMRGFYEVRTEGPGRRQYRLFCILENEGARLGLEAPSIVILAGLDKPVAKKFSRQDYARVKRLRTEFLARTPRSVKRTL